MVVRGRSLAWNAVIKGSWLGTDPAVCSRRAEVFECRRRPRPTPSRPECRARRDRSNFRVPRASAAHPAAVGGASRTKRGFFPTRFPQMFGIYRRVRAIAGAWWRLSRVPALTAQPYRNLEAFAPFRWCCRWVSNLRPLPYQGRSEPRRSAAFRQIPRHFPDCAQIPELSRRRPHHFNVSRLITDRAFGILVP